MPNLTELTANIIAARAAKKDMTTDELQQEMQMVYSFLKGIESGDTPVTVTTSEEPKLQKINFKQIFKKDEVICLICNKGFKTLKRHLSQAHQLKPGEYKKQFGIPSKYALIASSYSEERKKAALDRGQGEILAKAREARAAKKAAVPVAKAKTSVPVAKVKASMPVKMAKKK